MARILYVNQWFPPENGDRALQMAQALGSSEHEVEVLTGFPNYPTGRIFPGYRLRPYMREIMEGVTVHRVFLVPSHSRSSLGRAANYLSFFFSVLIFLLVRGRKDDVLYIYHPPITVGLAAAIAGLVTRRPFILEVQDLWPESVAVSGMSGTSWMARVLSPVCAFVYRQAAWVLGQSHGMTKRLVERGAKADRSGTLFNWADESALVPTGSVDLSTLQLSGRFNVIFGGNMGTVQGLDTVIQAAALAGEKNPSIQLVLVGGGVERANLEQLVRAQGISNVRFVDQVPQHHISDIFAEADVLVVHLKDDPLFEITIPSKTQFYLAMGRPILIGMRGEAADIVSAAGAGLAVPPDDVQTMAQAMLDLASASKEELAAMGNRGRQAYLDRYSFAAGQATAIAAVNQVLRARGGGQ